VPAELLGGEATEEAVFERRTRRAPLALALTDSRLTVRVRRLVTLSYAATERARVPLRVVRGRRTLARRAAGPGAAATASRSGPRGGPAATGCGSRPGPPTAAPPARAAS
jgi:hypothetical protein